MADLTIETSDQTPDSTYFTITSQGVEPELEGDVLTIYDGKGRRRSSWGAPQVTSTVVLHEPALVAVHVGFSHKHRGGQGYRYYVQVGGVWKQTSWASLTGDERQRVLDGVQEHAPSWAKGPGKLRTERRAPYQEKHLRYKIVQTTEDGRYVSAVDPEVEYELGRVLIQKARPEHQGGYYVYASPDQAAARFHAGRLFPQRVYEDAGTFALIECEVAGTCVEYDAAGDPVRYDSYEGERWSWQEVEKEAWTWIRPTRVLQTIQYAPAAEVAHAS